MAEIEDRSADDCACRDRDTGLRQLLAVARIERDAAIRERDALLLACEPFAAFQGWMEALAENGDIGPLEPGMCVVQLSGGGGSDALYVDDFAKLYGTVAAVCRAAGPGDRENLSC